MQVNLLELETSKLLKKFGDGNHKPGSGSAVALQGMLSAQLIRTVIDLTKDEKRRDSYKEILPSLLSIDKEIDGQIYPKLEKLLQDDSVQFDKVIKLRQAREVETDLIHRNELAGQAMQELKAATEIPIEIAGLCIKLAKFAISVFDGGFKSARGDSGVSLNTAVASVAGCLSIIDLNLLSFTSDKWTEKIRGEVNELRTSYKELYSESIARQEALKEEAEQRELFYSEINLVLSGIPTEVNLSDSVIESVATELQRTIWVHRDMLWRNDTVQNPIDVLKPEMVFKKMKYQFERKAEIGRYLVEGGLVEIAGQIDKQNKIVIIWEISR